LEEDDVTIEFLEYADEEENDYGQTIYPFNIRFQIDTDPSPAPSGNGVDTGTIGDGLYIEATGRRTDEIDVATFVVFDYDDSDGDASLGNPHLRPYSARRERFSMND